MSQREGIQYTVDMAVAISNNCLINTGMITTLPPGQNTDCEPADCAPWKKH